MRPVIEAILFDFGGVFSASPFAAVCMAADPRTDLRTAQTLGGRPPAASDLDDVAVGNITSARAAGMHGDHDSADRNPAMDGLEAILKRHQVRGAPRRPANDTSPTWRASALG